MSNMSYCRFQNTLTDLIDCQDNMAEPEDDMSDEEKSAKERLIKVCKEIADDYA